VLRPIKWGGKETILVIFALELKDVLCDELEVIEFGEEEEEKNEESSSSNVANKEQEKECVSENVVSNEGESSQNANVVKSFVPPPSKGQKKS